MVKILGNLFDDVSMDGDRKGVLPMTGKKSNRCEKFADADWHNMTENCCLLIGAAFHLCARTTSVALLPSTASFKEDKLAGDNQLHESHAATCIFISKIRWSAWTPFESLGTSMNESLLVRMP